MKTTSLEANRKAEAFKSTHKGRILNCLEGIMSGPEISEATGLKFESVMRRMSELENTNKVITKGSKNGFTLYKKLN